MVEDQINASLSPANKTKKTSTFPRPSGNNQKFAKLLTFLDLHLFINFHQYFFSRFFALNHSALLLTHKIISTIGKRLAWPRQ